MRRRTSRVTVTEEDYRLQVADGGFKANSSIKAELDLKSNLAQEPTLTLTGSGNFIYTVWTK